jgi:FKBP-type peptidyl-prolyl cis-trans isomerase 2
LSHTFHRVVVSLRAARMKTSRLAILTICLCGVVMVTGLTGLRLLSYQSFAAEPPRIIDGSRVTYMSRMTAQDARGFELLSFGQFVQGQHQLLPALEREVADMKPGDEKTIELSPDEGFGPYDAQKKKTVPRTELPAGTQEGDLLQDHVGKEMTVTRVSGSSAVVDYNHPLAGKPLSVKIQILQVEDPS